VFKGFNVLGLGFRVKDMIRVLGLGFCYWRE